MSVRILLGDVRGQLRTLPADSVDIVVTSPPYWGLRDYGVAGQMGMEPTLGEHIEAMVDVFREVRRVMKPSAPLWLNYGDCYATAPNGRSAAATKAAGNDDRTFRDKPFSPVGPIFAPDPRDEDRRGNHSTLKGAPPPHTPGRIVAGGYLKPKDLCLIPFRLAIALQEDGWWVRSRCMWGKPNGMPDSSGKYRPSVAHEEIFLLGKTGSIYYDPAAVCAPASGTAHDRGRPSGTTPKSAPEGTNIRSKGSYNASLVDKPDTRYLRTYEPDVWHIATAAYGEAHFATFPPALVERCLMAGLPKGQRCVVLDPFGGAGTTGLVADRMGHDGILIDLNPEYVETARKRIAKDSLLFADVTVEASPKPRFSAGSEAQPKRVGESQSSSLPPSQETV